MAVPIAPQARPPDRELVDELIAQRRERYRKLRQAACHDQYVVFPLTSAPKSNGQPRANGGDLAQQAVTALSDDIIDAADLQAGPSSSKEKVQKQSTAHLLLRMLGLSFVVPLCRIDASGLPSAVDRHGFSVADALSFVKSLLIERPDTLEHLFACRPAGHRSPIAPFESTTLVPWLVPRVLCASAVLTCRSSDALSPSQPETNVLHDALLDLAFLMLDLSLKNPAEVKNARSTIEEGLRASILALAGVGKSTFHYESAPPIQLAPQRKGDRADAVTSFFTAGQDKLSRGRPLGEGISGLWMVEDHAAFIPPWEEGSPQLRSELAHALFYESCELCMRLQRAHPEALTDLGDTAGTLLHSNWLCSLSLDKTMMPCSTPQQLINAGRIRAFACSSSSPVNFDRLSSLAARQLVDTLASDVNIVDECTLMALEAAMCSWASTERAHGAIPHLKQFVRPLVQRLLFAANVTQTSGAHHDERIRTQKDTGMRLNRLAFDGLLLVLRNEPDPLTLLTVADREDLYNRYRFRSSDSMDADETIMNGWMNEERQHEFISMLMPKSDEPKALQISGEKDVLMYADSGSIDNAVSGTSELDKLAQHGLTVRDRPLRLRCGRTIVAMVAKICEEASGQAFDPIAKRFDALFAAINLIIKTKQAKIRETAILCLAQLGQIDAHEVRGKVLHILILQLGSDPLTKSLAYTTITQLATHHRCTTFQLLAPHLDVIAPEIVERMSKSPMLFLEVLQLTRQNQSKFLQATLQLTLPRIIELEDDKTLNLIAKGIGADVQTMCFNNAPAILKSLLMLLPPPRRDRCIHTFIDKVRGEAMQSITLKSLLKSYSVELLGHLVTHLGDPAPIQRKRALEGLQCMNTVLNDRQRTNRSTASRDMALAQYLKDEILAILSWLNEELMNVHGKKSIHYKAMVTRSVGALIDLIGESISNVTPQLMATLNTTMQVRELMLPTLESWNTFVLRVRSENVGPFVGQMAAALLASWPKFGQAEKSVANSILTYAVVDSYDQFKSYLANDFPDLTTVQEDVPEVWEKLTSLNRLGPKRPEQHLVHILDRASNENPSVCGQALLELRTFLRAEQSFLEQATTGNAFDAVIGRMIRVLFDTAAHDDEETRDLSLENLGIVGALDPDRLPYLSSEQAKVPLNDFNDKEELTNFAVHLICDVLVGAYKATHDTKHQSALAYAIQELLKFCGFTTALLPARDGTTAIRGGGASVSLKTRQRWNALAMYIDTLAPLLESKYLVQHSEASSKPRPLYRHTSSFKEWIQSWSNDLILETNGEHASIVFGVFRSVIRDHDLSIAQYILPHLVLNAVTMGSDEQKQGIYEEIVAVLHDQIAAEPLMVAERRLLSAQVIFGLLDHMSVWQRARQREKARDGKQQRGNKRDAVEQAIARVDGLMQAISQDLMAKASLRCRAYARSLLNHEQKIRTLREQGIREEDLQTRYEDLHLIYANLDEPDGMEGVSSFVLRPSLEHQIREHESTGRWTSAQSCWEVKIQDAPNDLGLHVGLLRCLRNLGHYDTMRTHIRGVLSVHKEWEEKLAPFYVEGCCILSDWREARQSLEKSTSESSNTLTPQHAMARVMLAMHDHDASAFQVAIKDARLLLGKPLIGVRNSNDYIGVYDTVTQLHMLHELGMIGKALRLSISSVDETGVMSTYELNRSLSVRLDSTLPSFRTREPLLSMRRSALSTQQGDAALRDIAGQCWIASSKIARREGHLQTAYSAALQASQWKVPLAFVQHAKLLAIGDQGQAALQEVTNSLGTVEQPSRSEPSKLHSYANAHLFFARLADASGRRHPNEIVELYKRCTELDSQSEKMWYHLGRYYDQIQERDSAVRMNLGNPLMQHYSTCRYFLRSALYGTKYFYRTVPRVLTIWLTIGDEDGIVTGLRKLAKESNASTTSKNQEPRAVSDQVAFFNRINELLRRHIDKLAPYQWLAVFPQLVSRVAHRNDQVWKTLQDLISYVLVQYPDQAMWSMVAGLQSTDKQRRDRFLDIVNRVKTARGGKSRITRTVDQMIKVAKELLYLCDYPIKEDVSQLNMKSTFPELLALAKRGDLILPMQSSLSVTMPSTGTADAGYQIFNDNLPRIIDLDSTIKVMSSLQRPRKIIIKASDGQAYAFLCKPKDDLRKDARLMEFDSMINNLLQSNPESRKRRLYIRTYAVVTLNEECGLIEWVPNTIGLRFILQRLYASRGIEMYTQQIKTDMDAARKDPKKAAEIFEIKVLSKYPAVFHEWFVTTFPEPSAWLAARLNYGRTLAVMSMVGYVLGLGDRHGENILFDAVSGDTVHVDLNCLFEKGATFDIPERVPFRLTQNLVDALGVTGVEGVFRKAAEISMGILREHKDSLMSVLEAMVHDPLVEWGIDDRTAKGRSASSRVDPRVVEARKSLDPVSRKLLGQLRRTAGSAGAEAGIFAAGWTTVHSTNSLVDALIRDATSSTLLSQMYIGWTPYL